MTLARGIIAILGPGMVQMSVGNFIEPIVFGDKFDMHEVTVLAGLTLW
jgi:predicted PurR-regulated permease PerM